MFKITLELESILSFSMYSTALVALITAVKQFNTWYRVKKLDLTSISRLNGGLALVRGRVVMSRHKLTSPLTGKHCAYYHLQVRDRACRGNLAIHERQSGLSIFITDDTGRARLELKGVKIDVKPAFCFAAGFMAKGLPRDVSEYLQREGIKERIWRFQRDLACRETHIRPGEYVYVLGYCSRLGEKIFFHKRGFCPYIITKSRQKVIPKSPVPWWFVSASVGIYMIMFGILMYLN